MSVMIMTQMFLKTIAANVAGICRQNTSTCIHIHLTSFLARCVYIHSATKGPNSVKMALQYHNRNSVALHMYLK